MKVKKSELGFGATEFLSVIVLATIIIAIVLSFAISKSDEQKFQVFRYNALLLSMNAANYDMTDHQSSLYLTTLIDKEVSEPIRNPFFGSKFCDIYESKVVFDDYSRYVTLKCGDYLIQNQDAQEENYPIYKVGPWKEKKMKESKNYEIEEVTKYNFTLNDEAVLDDYVEAGLLVIYFNERNHTHYQTFEEVEAVSNLISKTYYRTKQQVAIKGKS